MLRSVPLGYPTTYGKVRRRWACRLALARLPHHAIEHHRRRPRGSVKTQPQPAPGQAPTVPAAGVVRNPAAAQATAASGAAAAVGSTHHLAGAFPSTLGASP